MSPIVVLIIGKILDYLADNSDEIIEAIKEQFVSARMSKDVQAVLQEFSYDPSETNLVKLSEALEAKGEDTTKLAALLVNKAVV